MALRQGDPSSTKAPIKLDPASPESRRQARYDAYIASGAWRESSARLEELKLSGGLCRLCARGGPEVRIEVHHRDYSRLGRERVSDLTTLCRECHLLVTNELRRRRYASMALPGLSDTPRVLADRTLTDRTRAKW